MARERLTSKKRKAAEVESYPGMIGQPERTFEPMDKYNSDAYKEPGWYYPSDEENWTDEERNEIGVGIMDEDEDRSGDANPAVKKAHVQRIRQAASKAVKLAVLLLGDKTPEEMIEAQARDFMRLGDKGLETALSRYAKTEAIYSGEEEDKKDEEDEDTEACTKKAEDAKEKKEDEAKGEEEAAKTVQEEAEEKAEGDKKKKAEDDDDDDDEEVVVEEKKKAGELDIELAPTGDVAETSKEDKALLDQLFAGEEKTEEDEEAEESDKKKKAEDEDEEAEKDEDIGAKKAGAQTLGGQPRVASAGTESLNLNELWKSAPDVSEVFQG